MRLQKEYNLLLDAKRRLPWIEVKPYQDGWHIYMDFRDDIKRRADYLTLRRALDLVSKSGTTRNPKIVRGIRGNRRPGAVYTLFNPEGLYSTTDHHREGDMLEKRFDHYPVGYYRMGYPPVLGRLTLANWEKERPDVQKWFCKVTDATKYWGAKEWYQANFPTYWMIVKTSPMMVTHTRDVDPKLMKREAELRSAMEEYWRECGGSSSWYTFERKTGNRNHRAAQRAAIQKVLKGETEDFEIKQKIRNYHD